MTKKIIIKGFSVLLLTVIMFSAFPTYEVKAVTKNNGAIYSQEIVSDLNIISRRIATEEKIMKYDAKTGTTEEVDMEQISSVLRSNNINVAEPYGNIVTENNSYNVKAVTADSNGMTKVTNTTSMPYRATCKIICSGGEATGFLVGPNLLLTAAHCVMKTSPSDKYANWTCYPAYNNGQIALNGSTHSTGWSQIYYSNNWVNTGASDYDWCLCVLEDDLGMDIGAYFGLTSYNTNSALNNVQVKALGYPYEEGVYDGEFQRYSIGTVSSTQNTYFICNAKTYHGMSGGPIMRTSDNYVVGLVKGGLPNEANTLGVKITQNILDLVNSLR